MIASYSQTASSMHIKNTISFTKKIFTLLVILGLASSTLVHAQKGSLELLGNVKQSGKGLEGETGKTYHINSPSGGGR